jgi:hypothetical protein
MDETTRNKTGYRGPGLAKVMVFKKPLGSEWACGTGIEATYSASRAHLYWALLISLKQIEPAFASRLSPRPPKVAAGSFGRAAGDGNSARFHSKRAFSFHFVAQRLGREREG